jgi:hypothetical protein
MGIRAKLEVELSGIGNGWTDVSHDLMHEETGEWGLPGNSPRNRVAKTGELHFVLNNHESNLAGKRGNYSPDHTNARVGWFEGIRIRYSQVVGATTFVKHVGTLDAIVPDPDPFAATFAVSCVSVDYMDDLARASSSGLAVQQNVRDDQIFSAVIAGMPRQPWAIQVSAGPDTFPVALDRVENETRRVSILQDVCMSSLSLCFVEGQTLIYEPRNIRASSTAAVDTFDAKLVGLAASRNRLNRLNRVEVTAHPRTVDANPTTVLWQLPAGNAIPIAAFTSVVLWTPYTDPSNPSQTIGGLAVQTPIPTTDYLFNAAADGFGLNRTGQIAVAISAFGNTAKVSFTNNGPGDGFLTTARILGKGIYDYSAVLLQAEDVDSQVQAGLNILSFDAPYQSSIATAYEISLYLVNLYKRAATEVKSVRFRCPHSDTTLAVRLLSRRISDRIALGESLTGLSTARHFFINAVRLRSDTNQNLEVEWLLAPADSMAYWLLGIAGRSELDNTTVLGFGLVLGHTDIAHGDTHGDAAHTDVAHSDSHTDTAHADVAHGDGATHGDVAHTDGVHADVAHEDQAHNDGYNDSAHSDVAHDDSHSDVAHVDNPHTDVAHQDVPHVDFHVDFFPFFSHDDTPHEDVSHGDSHSDVAHADTHNDVTHVDVAHNDNHGDSHTDVAHQDTAHLDTAHDDSSSHADLAHSDTAHGDVAHADVNHTDVAHSDSHTDSSHGDIN